eukprot:scaffold9388_cov148-Skeletonema_marinoi.AAC.25
MSQLLIFFCEMIVAAHFTPEEEFDGFAFIGADYGCENVAPAMNMNCSCSILFFFARWLAFRSLRQPDPPRTLLTQHPSAAGIDSYTNCSCQLILSILHQLLNHRWNSYIHLINYPQA